jgi:hypothetical protein
LNARHRVVGEDQNTVSIELSLPHRAIPGQGSATFIRNLELGNVLICAIRAFDPSIGAARYRAERIHEHAYESFGGRFVIDG